MTGKIEPALFKGSGFAISGIGHMAILTLGLIFAGANPFEVAPTQPITVDIVSANELEAGSDTPEAAPAGTAETAPSHEPVAPASQPQPMPQSTPPATPPPNPGTTRQALAPTQAAPSSPPSLIPWVQPPPELLSPEPLPPAQTQELNPGDMFGMPLTLPDGRLGGSFEAPAIDKANIPDDDIAAFRKRLKTCSILPAGVAAEARVTLRIHLNPDGTLTKGLDQNPHPVGTVYGVSVGGGDLFVAAMAAVRKCQPYKMLPPDRYEEWKTLDFTFTRENFGGG